MAKKARQQHKRSPAHPKAPLGVNPSKRAGKRIKPSQKAFEAPYAAILQRGFI